jgi:hypothetical protein
MSYSCVYELGRTLVAVLARVASMLATMMEDDWPFPTCELEERKESLARGVLVVGGSYLF